MRLLISILILYIPSLCWSQTISDDDVPSEASAPNVSVEEQEILLNYDIIRSQDFSNGLKIISSSSINQLNELTEQAQLGSPKSFSAYYLQFKKEGFTEEGLANLRLAEEKTINKAELYTDFIATAHILKDQSLIDEYGSKLRGSGFISSVVLEYNKNVLRSVKENKCLLITNGWDDTYPLLTLLSQENKSNITVVNVEWIYDSNYRKKLAGQIKTTNPAFSNPYNWINQVTSSTSTPVYYTPTLPNSELLKIQNEITPVGILFKKSLVKEKNQKSENISAWKSFSKQHIVSSQQISKNYIILLTLLEMQLANDKSENELKAQVSDYKIRLMAKHPSLN